VRQRIRLPGGFDVRQQAGSVFQRAGSCPRRKPRPVGTGRGLACWRDWQLQGETSWNVPPSTLTPLPLPVASNNPATRPIPSDPYR
jgi:hypothetical protein